MNDIDFFKLCDEARKELPDSNWYSLDINGNFKRDYNDIYKTNIGKLFNRLTFEQKTEIVSSIKATNPNFIHPAYKNYNDIKRFGHEGSLVDELSKSYYGSYYRGHRQEIIDAGDIKVMSEYIVTDPYFLNKSEVEKLYNIRDDKGNSFLHLVVNKLPINKLKYFINNIPEEARVAALSAVNNDGKNIFDLVRYDFEKVSLIKQYHSITDNDIYASLSEVKTLQDFFKLCDEARKELPDSNWYSLDINGDFKRDYNDIYKTNIGKLFNRLTFEQKTEIVSSIKATNPNFIHPAYKDYNDIKRFGHEGSLVDELSKSYYGSYYTGHRQEIIDAGDIKVMSEYIVTDPYFLNKSEVEKLYNIRDDKGNSFLHLVVNKLPINKLKYFINNMPEEARVAALLAVNNDGKNIFDLVRYDFLKKESIAAYLPHHERETVIKAITKLSSAALLETASASPIQSNSQQSNNKESKVTVDLDRAALLETTSQSNSQQSNNKESKVTADLDSAALLENASASSIQSNSQQSNNKESKVTVDLDSAALLETASAASIQSNSQQSNNKESKVTADPDSISSAKLETASLASVHEETIAEIDTNIISANIIELIKSSSGLFSDTEKNWQTVETIVKNLTKSDRLFVVSKALKEVDNTSRRGLVNYLPEHERNIVRSNVSPTLLEAVRESITLIYGNSSEAVPERPSSDGKVPKRVVER